MNAPRTSACLIAAIAASALLAAPARADDPLAEYAKAIAATPDDAKAYEAYGRAAIAAGKLDDAVAQLKVGVARLPDFNEGYYLLAYAFRKKQSWADAADYYRRCIGLKHKETDSLYGLGKSLAALGDKKGAKAAFTRFVSDEKRPQAAKFVEEAKAELAKIDPPPPAPVASPGALKAEADSLLNEKKFAEAAAAYRKAIDVDKGNLDLYNSLGNVYFTLKQYNDAAKAFKDATDRDSGYALGWYNLAHALRKADRKGEAVEAYRRYMKLKPEDPDPYYGLGQTLKALGDVPAAIVAFRRYVEMEKRPDEQRWVEKAKQELQAMEAMQKPATPAPTPGKVVDEKAAFDGLAEPFPGGGAAPAHERPRARLRDLHDPFMNPESNPQGALEQDGLIDPFARRAQQALEEPSEPMAPGPARSVRDYGRALTAFRRALAAQAEDVETRYERGVAWALQGKPREAIAAWNTIPLDDARVQAARRGVEHLRTVAGSPER
jgi:tetratricopeptide (TPR) repeat protein